jgi:uroporphyrin-3 C-methyltransferase
MDGLRERLRAADEQLGRQLEEQAERQQSALEAFRQGLREERAQSDRALRESLAEVARQAPPATSEWQQAEVQYLLRIANHRLLMERDVEGSLRLLRAADGVLAQLDDFSLHEVRARLADEIANLQAVEGTDLQGLFLRLEAAKHDLDRLPLREPSYRREPEPAAPPAAGLWAEIWQQVSGFVRIRRLDSGFKPLLAPEEGVYLELNLRLMLERGQLAALRREQMVYEQSLDTAIDWINDYLNVDERPVRTMLEELRALRQINLEQPLPDISGSLNALQQVLRNPA